MNHKLSDQATNFSSLLKRYAIERDATVTVEISGEMFRGFDFMTGTILKYYDDGNTIRKSYDDT